MFTPHDPGGRRTRSGSTSAAGVALLLLGVALMGYGAHYLAKNGNCSSTGYVSYGPVPRCGGNEALSIMSAFFIGPLFAVAGWLVARAWGMLWPTVCISVGAGLFTLREEATAAAGAKTFGFVAGICLFALAAVSVLVSLRKRYRARAGLIGPAGAAASPADLGLAPAPGTLAPLSIGPGPAPASGRSGWDAFDRIARLAQLRDTGALTEDEFEREKAKLLAQI